jgi:hypothetical protein
VNTSVHEHTELVQVTGGGTTRASFIGKSSPFKVVQQAAAAEMAISSGLDLTDPADDTSAPVSPAAISFDDEDTAVDTRTIKIQTNVAFRASVSPATDFVLEPVSPSLAKYVDGSVRLADSPDARGTYSFTVAARGANTSNEELAATLTISCTDLAVEDSPDDIAVTLWQDSALADIDIASLGNILYFAGTEDDDPADSTTYDNNYLSLGTWGKEITASNLYSTIAYFKWGSVVGFDNATAHTVFNSNLSTANNAVKFNPMPTATTFSTYAAIPYAGNADGKTIDPTNYTNTRAGKGDPCKLIGLTVAQLRGMASDANLTALLDGRPEDYKNWRMPTRNENCIFTDGTTSTSEESYGANVALSGGGTVASPYLVTFKRGGDAIIPAAGNRNSSGAVDNQGTLSYYWSATPSSTLADRMSHNNLFVRPAYSDNRSNGTAVRCVREY